MSSARRGYSPSGPASNSRIKELIDPIRFYIEIQDSRSEWNDDPFEVPARHINKLDFKQVQLQVITSTFFGMDVPSRLQVGRYTMDLGKRRLSARNRMRNTTNAFDGVHWWLGTNEEIDVSHVRQPTGRAQT